MKAKEKKYENKFTLFLNSHNPQKKKKNTPRIQNQTDDFLYEAKYLTI